MAIEPRATKAQAAAAKRSDTFRKFGPLGAALLAVGIITVAIMPSALNLPQSNPSTILEYAPVPPDDDSPPPTDSGFSSLGVAGSSSLQTGVDTTPELPDPTKDIPPLDAQRRCVDGRQTEDPSSPPCQLFFKGDNGGSTWQGVTRDEIIVLIYNQAGGAIDTANGRREVSPPAGSYCDIDILDCNGDGKSTSASERHVWMRIANAYSRYFNARYQTYGRRVHFWYYWSAAETASSRRGDAADNWERLKPFAVIDETWWGGFNEAYAEAMAFRDVMVVAGVQNSPRRSFFQQYAPKVWSYWPDIESWADLYVGWICQKVKDTPVTDAGPEYIGKPRKYGLMWTTDPAFDNLRLFKDLVKAGLKGCGVLKGDETEVTWDSASFTVDNRSDQTYGQTNVAKLQGDGVNTVLWLGGKDTKTTAAAGRAGYYPQWLVAGDRNLDGRGDATLQDQNVWRYAWTQSYQLREDNQQDSPAYQAYKEADPQGTDSNWADNFYRSFFMTFQMIQVAGPKLNPDSVDAGMHAIQRRDSSSPYVAACYFFSGDYSCVKDAHEAAWDPDVQQSGSQGCYRMIRGGVRYPRDRWAESRGAGVDILNYDVKQEPCNTYSNGYNVRAA